ncbi:unnamed protein product [Toxocara canis]|uniref:Transcriptional adapter 1 n=1 Tax=Toxocara canis TaxID=6265 RepID=A0A183V210_TOXCA|nr:unnamed protein product [Toxocara canis]
MEVEESGSRCLLYGAIDEHIVRMRDQIKVVLGKQRSKVYFSYFKEWLRGHKSREEFDALGLAMMPSDQKFVHSDFFLTMVKACSHKDESDLRADSGMRKRQRDWHEPTEGTSNADSGKKSRLLADVEYVHAKEDTLMVPAIPPEYSTMLEGLSEVPPFSGWLPNKGQVKGRMLLAAWEHGIEGVADDAMDPLLAATRTMMANLIEEAVKMKRTHLTTGSGFSHTYGVRKRGNSTGLAEGYIIVPSTSPISTSDFIDVLKVSDAISPFFLGKLVVLRP